jgi:SnoaL-like domain
METATAARRWADAWRHGWATLDPSFTAELYAPGATFVSQAFRAREDPAAYVRREFAEEEWADPWFGEPIVEGDRAAVEWYARMREDGRDVTISGVSLLRFDNDGRCIEQRDTWAIVDGLLER